ncbi:hypothetical protein GCM10023158_33360 [Gluconacetobacter tumulicola]
MVVDPLAIAAEAPGHMFGGVVERAMGVGAFALAPQGEAPRSVKIDITGKEGSRAAERDLGFQGAIEIFVGKAIEMPCNPVFQGVREVDLFASDTDLHVTSPLA